MNKENAATLQLKSRGGRKNVWTYSLSEKFSIRLFFYNS